MSSSNELTSDKPNLPEEIAALYASPNIDFLIKSESPNQLFQDSSKPDAKDDSKNEPSSLTANYSSALSNTNQRAKKTSIEISQDQPSYRSRHNQPKTHQVKPAASTYLSFSPYKIDKGFETETSRTSYLGPVALFSNHGNDLPGGLGRYLTPPSQLRKGKASLQERRQITENQMQQRTKQSHPRIRSVHPYYYVL